MCWVRPSRFHRSGLYSAFFVGLAALLLSACAGIGPQGSTKKVSYDVLEAERARRRKLEKENEKLKAALTKQTVAYQELERKMGMLQFHAMKKEIQIKEPSERQAELQEKLDEAIRDVVRAKAKLRSLESKAEAASNMAEAEVALKDLKAQPAGKEKVPEAIQAEHLLKMSAEEFKEQNYGGALYLTGRVKSLVKRGQERLMSPEKTPVRAEAVPFALPVPLQALKASNVREGPGVDFKVLFTLKKGSPVVGYSYKDQWVRVKHRDGRDGWVFHTLVDVW